MSNSDTGAELFYVSPEMIADAVPDYPPEVTARFLIRQAMAPLDEATPLPLLDEVDRLEEVRSIERENDLDGQHYAWIRLPRWLHHRRQTIKETTGSFVAVDLCSAFPVYSEMLRSVHFRRCFVKAKNVFANSIEEYSHGESSPRDGATSINRILKRDVLANFMGKRSNERALAISVVQQVLYTLQESDVFDDEEATQHRLEDLILSGFVHNTAVYRTLGRADTIEGRWQMDTVAQSAEQTLLDTLAHLQVLTPESHIVRKQLASVQKLLAEEGLIPKGGFRIKTDEHMALGYEHAFSFLTDLAHIVSRGILRDNLARPFRAISVDLVDAEQLLVAASSSFDCETKATGLYWRAYNNLKSGRDHLQLDIFDEQDLTFPEESVALFTCFEGWPLHFHLPDDSSSESTEQYRQQALALARRRYSELQKGGRIIIFPWNIIDKNEIDEAILEDVLETWEMLLADVTIKPYSRRQLYEWMSARERDQLVEHSPLFKTGKKTFYLLIVQKPHEGSNPIFSGVDD